MQITSASWAANVAAASRNISYGVLMSWNRTTASGIRFFTIGTSIIGGGDQIKSGGSAVAFFDTYQYTDYTNYAKSLSVDRRLGQYPYGTILAQADLVLDNSSKLFLPGYDATIGSGILPGRPLKISIGVAGELMNQFMGFTGTPVNTVMNRETVIHSYDAFEYINSTYSTASGVLTTSGSYVNLYAHQIIGDLLGEIGFAGTQYVLDQSLQRPIGYLSPANQKVGDIIQSLCEAEQALAFADENGIIRFWNRQHFTTVSGTQVAFTYSNLQDLTYADAPIINDVVVVANPRAQQLAQVLWRLQSTVTIPPGLYQYPIDFSDDNGSLPVTSVVSPTSGGSSNYTANTASDGSGSDVTTSVTIGSVQLLGTRLLVNFNNTTTQPAYLTAMAIYGTPATVTQPIQIEYKDTASIAIYGVNPQNNGDPITISNDLIQDSSSAYSLAYTLVQEYSKPLRRYENVPIFANPALQIGDYCQLTNADTGDTLTIFIVGIRTTLGTNGELNQFIDFEARNIQHYFTIGASSIGGLDTIAP